MSEAASKCLFCAAMVPHSQDTLHLFRVHNPQFLGLVDSAADSIDLLVSVRPGCEALVKETKVIDERCQAFLLRWPKIWVTASKAVELLKGHAAGFVEALRVHNELEVMRGRVDELMVRAERDSVKEKVAERPLFLVLDDPYDRRNVRRN